MNISEGPQNEASESRGAERSSAPARAYYREPEAERQLAELRGAPVSRIVALVADHKSEIREEVLVTLARQMQRAGETDAAWRIVLVLAGRVKRKIAQSLRVWRLDLMESVAEEVIEEVISSLYESVFDLSERTLFWEIRFWVAFNRAVLNIVRRKRYEIDHELTLDRSPAQHADGDDEALDYVDIASEILEKHGVAEALTRRAGLLDPLSGTLAGEALARLPRAERIAYILKHAAGLPEDSVRGEDVVTIASILGVSGRSIRNYLTRAEQELEAWREGRPRKRRRGPENGKSSG